MTSESWLDRVKLAKRGEIDKNEVCVWLLLDRVWRLMDSSVILLLVYQSQKPLFVPLSFMKSSLTNP